MIPKEVFLSHSSRNKAKAAEIATTLRNHGVPVWYSPTNIRSAQQWQDEIGKALRRCDWFVVLLSKDSVASKWVRRELSYALGHSQYDGHILPIRLDDCDPEELSWTLDIFQRVELNGESQKAYADILNTWGLGFDPAKGPPALLPTRKQGPVRRAAPQSAAKGKRRTGVGNATSARPRA
jgi:hypothetical protein